MIQKRPAHTENFTVLDNTILQNESLTWEARGLLAYLLSLPENWEVYKKDLINRSPAGRAVISRILKELEQHNHIKKMIRRDKESGQIVNISYLIVEIPFSR